ncbi:YdcF family protein [Aerococcus kribbianus]|uniref:YdcF family protein n=1 Tax=Aerococcus kribbianus TaxID=2999064 RepID=A0A9X3FX77_9LACT|nr:MULTISPECIES: YdcF family protein [unclassified Aerococcus]MCZ0717900.1 YdcF family protein [Aerococcus sp. YH-aer221]MCZ0726187.1 YdcF family protein [Aerococcus sp. YH-aer222]
MLYLIALALFILGVLILLIAPRNLIDNLIILVALIVLGVAIVNDPQFGDNVSLQLFFYHLKTIAMVFAPLLMGLFGFGSISFAYHLYQEESSRLQLAVGVALGLILLAMTLFHYYQYYSMDDAFYERWVTVPSFAMAYFVLLFFNYLLVSLRLSLLVTEKKVDYLVILGARLDQKKGVSTDLKSRLDMAVRYLERHKFLYQNYPTIIVSGAQTQDSIQSSEAKLMSAYLVDQGIPSQKIIQEEEAHSTHDNFIFTRQIIEGHRRILQATPIAFVTSNYHLYRAYLYAHMEGIYQIIGLGAPSPLGDRIFGMIREFIAILFMHRKFHFMMTILLLGAGLAWVHYFA